LVKFLQDEKQNIFEKYDRIAERALLKYEIETNATVRPLNYSENIVYMVEEVERNRRFIFRVGKPDYHSDGEVEAELEWMRFLKKESQLQLPDIITGLNGDGVQKIVSDDSNDIYYCVMFSYLTGTSLNDDLDHLPDHFERIGEITAELHNINRRYSIGLGDYNRPVWDFETTLGLEANWGRWQDGVGLTHETRHLFQIVTELIHQRLDLFGKSENRFGLIHADLRTVNLLSENQVIKVIDFDDCGYSWYLYDLAASLSFIEHMDYVPELIKLWISGYRRYRPLSDEEVHEIPTFIMLRRLLLLGWVGSHSDTETAQQMGVDFTLQTEALARQYLLMYR
jgi:Ser/Thr protein kinase RdoA (MazF antagonist)